MDPQSILLAAVVMALGSAAGYLLGRGIERTRQKKERAAARDDASRIIARANDEADTTLKAAALQGKEEVYRLRESWQSEEARRREEVKTLERRIGQRSDSLDRKFDRLNERETRLEEGKGALEEREKTLQRRNGELDRRFEEVEASERSVQSTLESLAGLSADEARGLLMKNL
ncbi:MAG: Rnase Y domain-containing protein, partial [Gammaproteobacteria bacterium]|nr:Rnase Y domain-containing protein [Gammaproteobacteria bacterium]